MRRSIASAAALLVLACCAPGVDKPAQTKPDVTPPAIVTESVDSNGIKTVVLRGYTALRATVQYAAGDIKVSGEASGGAGGFKPSAPSWKETPADKWGLGFVSKQFGDVLVISTRNEIMFIHHAYSLNKLVLTVPPGVEVVRVERVPSGNGAPDLSPPATVSQEGATSPSN